MKEMRILGPPGTGKSTRLATKEIPDSISRFGSEKVVVTSFTKAAAHEISTKKSKLTGESIDIPHKHVGTLHKFCFHMLGTPELAHTKLSVWDDMYGATYPINGGKTSSVDNTQVEEGGAGDGDILLSKLNILRAKLVPKSKWSKPVLDFEEKWNKFKAETDTMDFTDLIEQACATLPYAPGRPQVIFVDEAQDFTALQLKLVRSWAQQAQWLVLVGDDDQTIFTFAGATPDAFINPKIDDKFKRVLDQSWRVPIKIHEKAIKLIKQVRIREPKIYNPKPEDGAIDYSTDKYNGQDLDNTVDRIKKELSNDKTVMFLASCSYMLNNLIVQLKANGIPFANRYRPQAGAWNPLIRGVEGRISAVDIIENFHRSGEDNGYWTVKQFVKWAKFIKTSKTGLIRGRGKPGIKALEAAVEQKVDGLHTTREVIGQLMSESAVNAALNRDLVWLENNLMTKRQAGLKYPLNVFNNDGIDGITRPPKLTIGTIHSVKGGEAQTVFICPDISFKALKEKNRSQDYEDSLWRLFYVGITRASEKLIILEPASQKGQALYMEL